MHSALQVYTQNKNGSLKIKPRPVSCRSQVMFLLTASDKDTEPIIILFIIPTCDKYLL